MVNTRFKLTLKEGFTSSNLHRKISILEISTLKSMSEGMSWVKDNINGVLVGGTAVVNYLQSGRELTPDVDYLVSNINDVKKKLTDANISFTPLKSSNGSTLGITVSKFNIDFLDPNVGNKSLNALILKTKKQTSIGGISVDIIIPELLAILKLELGRRKDINDGFELLQSGSVNKDLYTKLVESLKKYLNDYESLISYKDLIK